MFRHKGKTRTLKHNLHIASLLSFVAGIVNVAGYLSVNQLTTNVTGHFAYFADELFKLNFSKGYIYFLYIFFFFFGSFISNLIVELISRTNDRYIYIVPTIIESIILFLLAVFGVYLTSHYPNFFTCTLLFAMGLQNSLVTKISKATVRTTHLTGLFTDLGIELSQLFFYKQKDQKFKLFSSIKLRLTIITFFFLGVLLGGILYSRLEVHILFIATFVLITGVIYDDLRLRLKLQNRKAIHSQKNTSK